MESFFLKVESRLSLISFALAFVESQTAFAVESIVVTVESTLALVVALSAHPVKIIINPTIQKPLITAILPSRQLLCLLNQFFQKCF